MASSSAPQLAAENSQDYRLTVAPSGAGTEQREDSANMVENQPQQAATGPNYTFTVNLLTAVGNDPANLQVAGTGTLTLDLSDPSSVTGVWTLPTLLDNPVPFTGQAGGSREPQGLPVAFITGRTNEVSIQATFSFGSDGWSYNGTYLGGMAEMTIEDSWQYYILQGLSPPAQG
jgi:hypothetical protein